MDKISETADNLTSGYGDKVASTHSTFRTSPKGQPYVGECMLCGKTGLTASQTMQPCENVEGKTEGDALILAISGGQK